MNNLDMFASILYRAFPILIGLSLVSQFAAATDPHCEDLLRSVARELVRRDVADLEPVRTAAHSAPLGQALIIHGWPGIGKTTFLDELTEHFGHDTANLVIRLNLSEILPSQERSVFDSARENIRNMLIRHLEQRLPADQLLERGRIASLFRGASFREISRDPNFISFLRRLSRFLRERGITVTFLIDELSSEIRTAARTGDSRDTTRATLSFVRELSETLGSRAIAIFPEFTEVGPGSISSIVEGGVPPNLRFIAFPSPTHTELADYIRARLRSMAPRFERSHQEGRSGIPQFLVDRILNQEREIRSIREVDQEINRIPWALLSHDAFMDPQHFEAEIARILLRQRREIVIRSLAYSGESGQVIFPRETTFGDMIQEISPEVRHQFEAQAGSRSQLLLVPMDSRLLSQPQASSRLARQLIEGLDAQFSDLIGRTGTPLSSELERERRGLVNELLSQVEDQENVREEINRYVAFVARCLHGRGIENLTIQIWLDDSADLFFNERYFDVAGPRGIQGWMEHLGGDQRNYSDDVLVRGGLRIFGYRPAQMVDPYWQAHMSDTISLVR